MTSLVVTILVSDMSLVLTWSHCLVTARLGRIKNGGTMFDAILNALVSTPAYDLGARAGATFLMLDRLEKLGLVFSPSVCEFHARGCDLDAYAISSDGKSASLY